jgi:excisionase family DNA binding protein
MVNKTHVMPCLVDVKDAARMLAVSERTIWRLVELGQLPAPLHVGRAARWRVTDLMSFIYPGELQTEAE